MGMCESEGRESVRQKSKRQMRGCVLVYVYWWVYAYDWEGVPWGCLGIGYWVLLYSLLFTLYSLYSLHFTLESGTHESERRGFKYKYKEIRWYLGFVLFCLLFGEGNVVYGGWWMGILWLVLCDRYDEARQREVWWGKVRYDKAR